MPTPLVDNKRQEDITHAPQFPTDADSDERPFVVLQLLSTSTLALLKPIADKLISAGARHVSISEHRERMTGGNWLTAEVIWRHQHHRLTTDQIAYESWTENVLAMCSRLQVLAAQLATRTT